MIIWASFIAFFSLFSIFGGGDPGLAAKPRSADTGIQEKLIVANGDASIILDLKQLNGKAGKGGPRASLHFDIEQDSFFPVIVFNNEFRGALPGSMPLTTKDTAILPAKLSSSYRDLIIESLPFGESYDLVVRDAKSGFVFFNVEGYESGYNPLNREFEIRGGRLLVSKEFAAAMKRPSKEGAIAGEISLKATMRPIEITEVIDGEAASAEMPAVGNPQAGSVPGPDVVVGEVSGLAQFGSSVGTQVGLALGTDSCNFGTQDLNWFALPSNDHPVIPQNLYRMSGGATNNQTFEQIGQSSVKHGFTALANNLCGLGCVNPGTGTRLGSGCSDPYSASLNAGPNLGSRAWINPFTGAFPRGDSATPPNSHTGHTHTGTSHRILTEIDDLNTNRNPGATYYAEGQYVTPHEYAWCQANPTQCNMFNNISYRRYTVTGTGSPFTFSAAAATVRQQPAINAWTGATLSQVRPDLNDGIAIIGHKVTNTAPGVWHYEYAIYNQNLDRAIQSFTVPKGSGVTISNIGFHAPPQHPGWAADGTTGNSGYSSAPWTVTQATNSITWSSETLAQNPNANALRWGTLYNFRFDANQPPGLAGDGLAPQAAGTLGFFKSGAPITVAVPGPGLAPTAAVVSVAGRVLNADGRGVRGAAVVLTDHHGEGRRALTSSLGYYRFEDVPAGQGYTVSVSSKGYQFASRTITAVDNITGLDFIAEP